MEIRTEKKSVCEVANLESIAPTIVEFSNSLSTNEHLMGFECKRGLTRDGEEKFTLCFESFVGDLEAIKSQARQRLG